jgi:5-methylcytosine-specific restriction endonuclease McrA
MRRASWKEVHGELTRLASVKGAYDADEARWLVEGKRVRVHEPLGYGSYLHYLEQVFGYGPRQAGERLRVAEALVRLPALMHALADSSLPWSSVRELVRVVAPATEAEWLAAARGKTVREIEDMVSGRKPGDRPADPADPGAIRHVLRLELSADSMAAFRDARRRIELEAGQTLDDDAAVRMLAHYALGGPGDPGRAAYQVAMTVCERCGRGSRDGAGRVFAVEPHQIDAACCDAQHIGPTHVGHDSAPASQSIPPRIRRLVWRRDHGRCQAPGCRASRYLEVHHIVARSDGGTHDPSNLVLMCSAHHTRIHEGSLHLGGSAPDRLEFRPVGVPRPDDAPSELDRDPDEDAVALATLRRLGVTPGDARRALAAASPDAVGVEELVRQALVVLARTTYASRISEPAAEYRVTRIHAAAAPPLRIRSAERSAVDPRRRDTVLRRAALKIRSSAPALRLARHHASP